MHALESILAGLNRPDGEDITTDQRNLRRMITTLQALLRHAAESRLGRYGEQEIRGFVPKLKSTMLHDDVGTYGEEEANNSDDETDNESESDTNNEDSKRRTLHPLFSFSFSINDYGTPATLSISCRNG